MFPPLLSLSTEITLALLQLKTELTFMQERLITLVEHPWFSRVVIGAILGNAVTLGLETNRPLMETHGVLLHTIDLGFMAFFVAELLLKLLAYGRRYFREGWNIFDFTIVTLTLLPFIGNLSVLRALRILRVLRLLSVVPQFRVVISGFFRSLSGLVAVGGILIIILYVSAVLASKLFGDRFPELFGTLPQALFTLFQLMTLEAWTSEIARPVMGAYPYAWIFFILFILVTTFTMLNLLIGVVVSSMQEGAAADQEATRALIRAELVQDANITDKLAAVEQALADLKDVMQGKGPTP